MISVIVPVYNVENYLDACIESIVNQTYKNLEIILVEDGSPDNCPKICDEWSKKDKRIKVVHKENGGLSSARNTGLDIATGEFVAFVDSDDTIDINMYKTMIGLFSNDVDIVICGHQKVSSVEDITICNNVLIEKKKLSIGELYDDVFGKLNNASWNKLYRHSLIDGFEFPVGIIHGEDLIFNLHYLRKCRNGVKCDCNFYHYYSRENSITKSKFSENKFLEIKAKDIARDIVRSDFPIQNKNADKYCFRARMNVIRAIYSAKQSKKYKKKLEELTSYVKENFSSVNKSLKFKEKVEYYLYCYCIIIYKFILNLR